jgi:hypothetical protein
MFFYLKNNHILNYFNDSIHNEIYSIINPNNFVHILDVIEHFFFEEINTNILHTDMNREIIYINTITAELKNIKILVIIILFL